MTALQTGAALMAALILLLAGALLRSRSRVLTSLFMPASLVAGALALLAGPAVLGAMAATAGGPDSFLAGGFVPGWMRDVWRTIPGLVINVVFAALFLGTVIPSPARIWRMAGPQVAFGQMMAWGQYVMGLLLAIFILTPVFDMSPAAGALIEIAFEGGHGTAAGLAGVFEAFGFPEGLDLALGLATVGVVSAVLVGMVLINWGARRGLIDPRTTSVVDSDQDDDAPDVKPQHHGHAMRGRLLPGAEVIEPLTIAAGFIALATALGWLMLQALVLLEQAAWASSGFELMRYMPLFPFAMLGGIAIQAVLDGTGLGEIIDRRHIVALQGLALDLLIVTAIATLSLAAIGQNFVPFLLLAAAGLGWSILCFLVLAPRMLPDWWFERALADLGQSLGMTATGILLVRIADPAGRSPAMASFGYKQLLFEPIVGGGLFTAAAIPLIMTIGPWPVLGLTAALTVAWLLAGLLYFGRLRPV